MSYQLRIILLSLGVLFGFGSAFAHLGHGHRRCHERHESRGDPPSGHWRWEAD